MLNKAVANIKYSPIIFILGSTLFFFLMKLGVKYLYSIDPGIPTHEIIFFRSIITGCISFYFLRKQSVSIWGKNRFYLFLRGVFGLGNLLLFFESIRAIPLATAVTLQYLSPIFTAIFGYIIIKEPIKWYQFLFFGISFLGIFIIQGFETKIPVIYLGMGLGSAVCAGMAYTTVRKLRGTEHPLVIVLYFPLVSLPLVTPLVWIYGVWPSSLLSWYLLLFIGLMTQLGQYCLTKAIMFSNLNRITPYLYLGVLYSILVGFWLFNEVLTVFSYIGIGLIVTGVLLNFWFTRKN